jgi:hypothetical protein
MPVRFKDYLTVQQAPVLLNLILTALDSQATIQIEMQDCTVEDMDWANYILGPLYGAYTSDQINQGIQIIWNVPPPQRKELQSRYAGTLKLAREAFQLARYFGCLLSYLPPLTVGKHGPPLRALDRNRRRLAPDLSTPELAAHPH